MRRKVYDYSLFNPEIKIKDIGNGSSVLSYLSVHGNPVREVVDDKDKRIKEINKERKKFSLVVDGKLVRPIA